MRVPGSTSCSQLWSSTKARLAAEFAANAYGLEPAYVQVIIDRAAVQAGSASLRCGLHGQPMYPWAEGSESSRLHALFGNTARLLAREVRGANSIPPVSAWSTHPVAAAVIAASGSSPPHVPPVSSPSASAPTQPPPGVAASPHVALQRMSACHGIFVLERALIMDSLRRPTMTVRQLGSTVAVELRGTWPDTIADALVGRAAADICDLFAADPRGAVAVIEAAENIDQAGRKRLRVRFADTLVPVLKSEAGGERWRPTRVDELVLDHSWQQNQHQFRHAFATLALAMNPPPVGP